MFTKLFKNISKKDICIAGGKGASLGEMTRVNPITNTDDDTTTTTTADNGTDDTPLIDLPGFEMVSAIIAFSFVTMVIRRRKA